MPFFSVIIPLYNKEQYILECLESALHQSFKDFEIIIVNDGSTDYSVEKVEKLKSEKITIHHQDNKGVSETRNNGAKLSSGEYLAFLDADDIWKPDHLQCLYESIQTFPNSGLYANNYYIKHSKSYSTPATLNVNFDALTPIQLENFFLASLKDTIVWTSATVIEKTKFMSYGMFNTAYPTGEDLDLWIRIALKEPIIFHPKHTMTYNKSIHGSLGKLEYNTQRLKFLSAFKHQEETNSSLKAYLDLKRYGLAIRTKINGELKIFNETKKLIDNKNLNVRQRLFLSTPSWVLKILTFVRAQLIKKEWYLKTFKG